MSAEAFGPNLRRQRVQSGVSLEQIADATKVSVSLWTGLERNDFSRWPNGIYARAYVRAYALAIGADPEATVDEFCRWFPQGDRRAGATIREHAEIIGHAPAFRDEVPQAAGEVDRRGSKSRASDQPSAPTSAFGQMFVRLRRAIDRA